MTHPLAMEHDLAVVAALASIGREVGYAAAPGDALAALIAGGPGYMIVYPIPGGWRDGPVADPYTDVEAVYQVTCVDRLPEGVQWLADRCLDALSAVTVTGRTVLWVTPEALSGVTRDDTLAVEPLYMSTPRFRIATTPT